MTNMVEKVARAIARHEYEGGHLGGAEIEACVEEDMKSSRRKYLMGLARAAISAMRTGQPMETAPTDGTAILLMGRKPVVAWWGDLNAADSEFGKVEHEPRWCWLGHGDGKSDPVFLRLDYIEPTSWMPIPGASPDQAEETSRG